MFQILLYQNCQLPTACTLAPAALSTIMNPPQVWSAVRKQVQGGRELPVHLLASCVLGQTESSYPLAKKTNPPFLPPRKVCSHLSNPRGVINKSQQGVGGLWWSR